MLLQAAGQGSVALTGRSGDKHTKASYHWDLKRRAQCGGMYIQYILMYIHTYMMCVLPQSAHSSIPCLGHLMTFEVMPGSCNC